MLFTRFIKFNFDVSFFDSFVILERKKIDTVSFLDHFFDVPIGVPFEQTFKQQGCRIGITARVHRHRALAPAVRLTELGIREVDKEVVEAANAFGARPGQTLREVQLPLALPTIAAGINQVIMLALSMVVVAGMAGAGGLGAVVTRAVTQLDVASGVQGGIAVVILAIYLDRVTSALVKPEPLWRRFAGKKPPPVAAAPQLAAVCAPPPAVGRRCTATAHSTCRHRRLCCRSSMPQSRAGPT